MKVIDARSGKEVKIGDRIEWGDGEFVKLLDVESGLFSASAFVEIGQIDHTRDVLEPLPRVIPITGQWKDGRTETVLSQQYRVVKNGPIVTIKRQIPLTVKWLHPSFLFQHVAFINS